MSDGHDLGTYRPMSDGHDLGTYRPISDGQDLVPIVLCLMDMI
jgi:hypothetical protein